MDEIAPAIAMRELVSFAEPGLIEEEPSKAPPTDAELALAAEREEAIRLVESAPEVLPLEAAKPAKRSPSGSRR
jgi:hypothetical protein